MRKVSRSVRNGFSAVELMTVLRVELGVELAAVKLLQGASISAIAASLETNARPAIGSRMRLQHPEAGAIEGEVIALGANGLTLGFALSERSVAFALAATTADMSRPRWGQHPQPSTHSALE